MSVNINGTTGVSLLQQAAVDEKEILQEGDYGIGTGMLFFAGNFDTLTTPGVYALNSASTNGPIAATAMILQVITGTLAAPNDRIVQIAYDHATGEAYFRAYRVSWTAWKRVYTNANILGTVSQSSGVPTGSIIERGSNANGEYAKFADGTLICEVEIPTTLTSGGTTATFPATFVNSDYGFSLTVGSNAAYFATGATRTTTSLQVYAWSTSGVQSNRSLFLTAIGRWF